MKVNYVYKTVNLVNSKFYIGCHQGSMTDVEWYKGSGAYLGRAIEKYGIHNFITGIIQVFDSVDDMYDYEKLLVTSELVSSPYCYNLKLGGLGGFDHVDNSGKADYYHHTDSDKNLVKLSTDDPRVLSGEFVSIYKGTSKYYHKDDPNKVIVTLPVTHPEVINKTYLHHTYNLSAYRNTTKYDEVLMLTPDDPRVLSGEFVSIVKGKIYINNGTYDKMIYPEDIDKYPGFTKGRISRAGKLYKSTCPHCGLEGSGSNMTRYHYNNCKSR